jgi:hypothetical protein
MATTFAYDSHIQGQRAAVATPHGLADWQKVNSTFRTEEGAVTFGTYSTGGVAVSPAKFGLKSVSGVLFRNAKGYIFDYDAVADKIKVYTAANTEVSNGTDLSTLGAVYFVAKGQ